MDFVFTVCDNAAKEVCPIWPGQPMTAHWGVPDPAAVAGSPEQIEKGVSGSFRNTRPANIALTLLAVSSLEKMAIQREIDRIGKQ